MNWRLMLLYPLLAAFSTLSLWAMYHVGYVGIWQSGLAGPGAMQILVDLVIVCALAMVWMLDDARRNGLSAWPFVLITLGGGSFGPLLYLIWREHRAAAQRHPGLAHG